MKIIWNGSGKNLKSDTWISGSGLIIPPIISVPYWRIRKRKAGHQLDREVIKQKIEKLLALSESTNENEAMSAARTARKLMLKYHISMAEGERADRERTSCSFQVSIKELRFKRIPIRQQHLMLAFILAKNFRCKTFYQYGKTPCVKFIGFEEDTFAALALL